MKYHWEKTYREQIRRYGDSFDALYRDRRYIIVSGHRGMKALYPENTLLSFQKAIEAGVDSLEMDVNMTKDLVPVVCHDLTVDRTTNGSGFIRDHAYKEIQKLDAGCKFPGGAYGGIGLQIPTLEAFCALVQPYRYLLLNVEIKDKTQETVDQTMAMMGAFGLLPRCVFTCFDASIVHYMVDTYGVKAQGFLAARMPHFQAGEAGTYSRLYAVGIGVEEITAEVAGQVEAGGMLAWSWCPDTAEAVRHCVTCGARLMTCNDPYPAMAYVRALGKAMLH